MWGGLSLVKSSAVIRFSLDFRAPYRTGTKKGETESENLMIAIDGRKTIAPLMRELLFLTEYGRLEDEDLCGVILPGTT